MRCKMNLVSITKTLSMGKALVTARFQPVYDGSEENKKFFASTPSGSLDVGTVNEEAVKDLVIGNSYYIDITEAPK